MREKRNAHWVDNKNSPSLSVLLRWRQVRNEVVHGLRVAKASLVVERGQLSAKILAMEVRR